VPFAYTGAGFAGSLAGNEDVAIVFNVSGNAFNTCKTFSIKIHHTDLLDIRRTTTAFGTRKDSKCSFTYKTEEVK